MASVAEPKKSFFAEIDKVEKPQDLEKLRVKYLGRQKGPTRSFCLTESGCRFGSVHPGHHQIQHDQVRLQLFCVFGCFYPIGGLPAHFKTRVLQDGWPKA